jgi:hypothetical protein
MAGMVESSRCDRTGSSPNYVEEELKSLEREFGTTSRVHPIQYACAQHVPAAEQAHEPSTIPPRVELENVIVGT